MSTACGEKMDCPNCSRSIPNPIIHVSHKRGFHVPVQRCETNVIIFVQKGTVLVNSKEYAGTTLREGEFILQAIGSKIELLAMTDVDCIYFRFDTPELFCYERYEYIISKVSPPLINFPLKIVPEMSYYLNGVDTYMKGPKICRDLLAFKRKEIGFILGRYYSDYELASLLHPLSQYTTSFEYFILQNHMKVKTVEEFAQLGGYTVTTFRRIFKTLFKEPAYEWMLKKRKEEILNDLYHSNHSISEICYKYSFESLSHFSNFCKKFFDASPRNLRAAHKSSGISYSQGMSSTL